MSKTPCCAPAVNVEKKRSPCDCDSKCCGDDGQCVPDKCTDTATGKACDCCDSTKAPKKCCDCCDDCDDKPNCGDNCC